MTSEEMKKAIEFILDQQAKAEVRQAQAEIRQAQAEARQAQFEIQSKEQIEFVLKERAKTESIIQSVMEVVREMARGIAQLTVNAENDRNAAIRERNNLWDAIIKIEDQADKDRKQMKESVENLSNIVAGIHTRVSKLEDKQL